MEEYEIDLRELFFKLWRGKYIIIGVFILAVLLASFYTFVYLDPVFESRATLRIRPVPGEANGTEVVSLSLPGYVSFFTNQLVMNPLQEKIARDFDREITVRGLENRLEAELDEEDNFFFLSFRDNNPEAARDILSAWIETYNEELRKYITSQNRENLGQLETTMRSANRNFVEINDQLIFFQKENNIDQMESRLSWLERNVTSYMDELQQAKVELEVLRITSPLLEDLVASEEGNVDEVIRSMDRLLEETYFQNLKHLALHLEEVSPVWVFLRQRSIDQQVRLEELQNKKSDLEKLTEEMHQEIEELQVQLLEVKAEKIDLQQRQQRAQDNLVQIIQNYESLTFFLDNLSGCGVVTMEEPYIREGRVAPNHKLNLALAGVLGIFLGTGGLLFYNFLQVDEKEK